MQGEKRYIISQPIGTIWCGVCELAKGGMFKVENAEISIEQKLNQAWNCSNCHAPNPGPTRLADPNRVRGRETKD